MLQDKTAGRANLPFMQSAIRTLQTMRPRSERSPIHNVVDLAENLERMARSVYPDFRATPEDTQTGGSSAVGILANNGSSGANPAQQPLQQPTYPYPSMPFGIDVSSSTMSPSAAGSFNPEDNMEQPADLNPADGGWNFDFATADMEAFLSIDPNWASDYQLPTYP